MGSVYNAGVLYICYTDRNDDGVRMADEDVSWQDPSNTELERDDAEGDILPELEKYLLPSDADYFRELFTSVYKQDELHETD